MSRLSVRYALLAPLLVASCISQPPCVPEPTEGFVEVGSDRLHWRADGAGAPVVFVNGGAMDLRQWEGVVDSSARRHRVLRFDHRGWGRSSGPTEPFDPAKDLAALLDRLGVERAAVVGFSFGGGVALDFALERPERVRVLVLVAPALGGYPWSEAFRERHRRFDRIRESEGTAALVRAILEDPYFAPGAAEDPRLYERARRLLEENPRVHEIDPALYRRPAIPAIERLRELRVSTLVLLPERDDPDVAGVCALLAERIENRRLVRVRGAGHVVHLERPDALRRIALDFLRGAGG